MLSMSTMVTIASVLLVFIALRQPGRLRRLWLRRLLVVHVEQVVVWAMCVVVCLAAVTSVRRLLDDGDLATGC